MSMPKVPSPAEDPALYANSNGEVLRAFVTLLVLPAVFVTLRLTSRYMAGAGLWWDDALVILGMVFSWGADITMILASKDSLGHHFEVLSLPNYVSFYKHIYAFQLLYFLAMGSLKMSVIVFQYRIFPIASFRRVVKICGAIALSYALACTIAFIMVCIPVNDFWTHFSGAVGGGRCYSLRTFLEASGSINTITDFAILLLPLPVLWRLKASRLQIYLLIGIFISGLIVTAISMVRLIVLAQYHGKDITYDFLPATIWTAAEPSVAVATACLPSLRPLFVRLFRIGAPRAPASQADYYSSSNNLASTWRSGSKVHDRTFNRLPDNVNGKSRPASVANGVMIYGGKGAGEEEMELEEGGEGEMETPINRIKAKTTVVMTISDRVDWQDDLF